MVVLNWLKLSVKIKLIQKNLQFVLISKSHNFRHLLWLLQLQHQQIWRFINHWKRVRKCYLENTQLKKTNRIWCLLTNKIVWIILGWCHYFTKILASLMEDTIVVTILWKGEGWIKSNRTKFTLLKHFQHNFLVPNIAFV